MIVQTTKHQVISQNTGNEHVAKIKQSPKAFEILSGSLYSDKILAVVRELACNASDAHTANCNPTTPFEIKLPSSWDASFYVKDFGTGLSEEQIYNLYMTYFESSKQDSNDFVGQLGLGSKTPFSYGTTFNVESRQDGVKKVYTCYKNEDGCPAVALMDTAPTDEVNGLTVSMSVRKDDVYRFQTAAKYALMYFAVKPTIVGVSSFTSYPVEYTVDGGSQWKVRSDDNIYSGVRVVQGTVSYPVDMRLLQETLGTSSDYSIIEAFDDLNLDMFVPIGQVDIAPSREALTYNMRTAKNMYDIITNAYEHFQSHIQKQFDDCPTLWEATLKYDQCVARVSGVRSLIKMYEKAGIHFTHGQNSLQEKPELFDEDDWRPTSFHVIKVSGSSLKVNKLDMGTAYTCISVDTRTFSERATKDVIFVVDTKHNGRTRNSYLRSYLWLHGPGERKYKRAVVIYPSVEGGTIDQKELDMFFDLVGNPPSMKLSDIPAPPKGSYTAYKPKALDEVMVWQGFQGNKSRYADNTFGRTAWQTQQVDLSEGGFYVDVDRFEMLHAGVNMFQIDKIITHAIQLGLITTRPVIYGLNEKKFKVVSDKGNFVNFIDYITQEFNNLCKTVDLASMNTKSATVSWMNSNTSLVNVVVNWSTEYEATNNTEWLDFFENLRTSVTLRPDEKTISGLNTLTGILTPKVQAFTSYDVANALTKTWDTILVNNPTVRFIDLYAAAKEQIGRELICKAITK